MSTSDPRQNTVPLQTYQLPSVDLASSKSSKGASSKSPLWIPTKHKRKKHHTRHSTSQPDGIPDTGTLPNHEYKCGKCHIPKTFANARDLREHHEHDHRQMLDCPNVGCDRVFARHRPWRRHLKEHREENKRIKRLMNTSIPNVLQPQAVPITFAGDAGHPLFTPSNPPLPGERCDGTIDPASLAAEDTNDREHHGKAFVMNRFLSEDSGFESLFRKYSIAPSFQSPKQPIQGSICMASSNSGIPAQMLSLPKKKSLQPPEDLTNGEYASLPILIKSPQPITANDERQHPNTSLQSSSREVSTSEASQETSSGGDILQLVLGKMKAEMIASKMTILFETLIEHHCGIRTTNGDAAPNRKGSQKRFSATAQSASQPLASQDGKDGQQGGPKKRPSDGDDDDNDDNDDTCRGKKKSKANATEKQKLVCPFMKRHPVEFSTWRTCPGPGFDGLNRMKEHLKRKHLKEHECQRCGNSFENARTLQSHLREIEPCPINTATQKMGLITQVQWDEIGRTRKTSSVSEHDIWRQIYSILFPEVDPWAIPSPYFEHAEFQSALAEAINPTELEAYVKEQLPKRVLIKLQQQFQMFSDQAKQMLVEMIQEEAVETLKSFMLQKGTNPASAARPDAQITLEQETWGLDILGQMNSFGDLDPTNLAMQLPYSGDWLLGTNKEAADSAYESNEAGSIE